MGRAGRYDGRWVVGMMDSACGGGGWPLAMMNEGGLFRYDFKVIDGL